MESVGPFNHDRVNFSLALLSIESGKVQLFRDTRYRFVKPGWNIRNEIRGGFDSFEIIFVESTIFDGHLEFESRGPWSTLVINSKGRPGGKTHRSGLSLDMTHRQSEQTLPLEGQLLFDTDFIDTF